jgi:hypothetical protein
MKKVLAFALLAIPAEAHAVESWKYVLESVYDGPNAYFVDTDSIKRSGTLVQFAVQEMLIAAPRGKFQLYLQEVDCSSFAIRHLSLEIYAEGIRRHHIPAKRTYWEPSNERDPMNQIGRTVCGARPFPAAPEIRPNSGVK